MYVLNVTYVHCKNTYHACISHSKLVFSTQSHDPILGRTLLNVFTA